MPGPPTRMDREPKEIRDLFHKLVRQGRTIQEIVDHLRLIEGREYPHSTMAKYVKKAREQLARYEEIQAISAQVIETLGEEAKGDLGALLARLLQVVAFQQMSMINADEKMDPKELASMAKAVKDLEYASRNIMERRVREQRLAIEKAKGAVRKVGKRVGISKANIKLIEEELNLL